MNLTVMRQIHFNAGHRLIGHEGKCAFFHGHNYRADFYVSGSETDNVGRVIDFAQLKQVLKTWIDEHWDHGFILSKEDRNGIEAIQMVDPSKFYLLPYNPTAENMARYLLEETCPKLLAPLNVRAWKVALWETAEACAEVTVDDLPHFSEAPQAIATCSAND